MATYTIGQTSALIPEASTPRDKKFRVDGKGGDTNFPYGRFKPLATVGEVDKVTRKALTGYPDGIAAWLQDDKTVRVAYQSESYGSMSNETYGSKMKSGVKFTGSKIHYIDFDRAQFASYLDGSAKSSSQMVKGSGEIFDRVYNVFGVEVKPKNSNKSDLAAKWGNQVNPDGSLVEFKPDMQLKEGDFFFQSFCGAWYQPANYYGSNIGFANDVWLAAEEWNIGEDMFVDPDGEKGPLTGLGIANQTMGLASVVVDIAAKTLYTAPALGQSGYEKILPINPNHKDFVVMVLAGYNHEIEPAPNRVYIGRKDYDASGKPADYSKLTKAESFLARNGLLYGQIYGLALSDKVLDSLSVKIDPNGDKLYDEYLVDSYLKNASAPNTFSGRFYPTSYRWQGFDKPQSVENTEVKLWQQASEQPKGYKFFNGDTKTEHPAADPSGKARYFQNMTDEGALLGFDLGDLRKQLTGNDIDANGLPDYLNVSVRRTVAAVDGALTLKTKGKGLAHVGPNNLDGSQSAERHVDKGVAKMVAPDGLLWAKASDGDVLIVDEDSGNKYGERKYVLPIKSDMQLRDKATGYFLAQGGGALNPRAVDKVAAMPGTFKKASGTEFSGSWDVTSLIARKNNGSFYSKKELADQGTNSVAHAIPLSKHAFVGTIQQSGESGGQVSAFKADQGGQLLMFGVNLPDLI